MNYMSMGFGMIIWLGVKHLFGISDRYLPGLESVVQAVTDLKWDLMGHVGVTTLRALSGTVAGISAGIAFALVAHRFGFLAFSLPTVNALRAVPAVALVPFFLLWFGFSEVGRYILIILAVGLNVCIGCAQTLLNGDERDHVIFGNYGVKRNRLILKYWFPRVLESILPTLRVSVSLALGAIIVAEMLGAQSGIGYLMQTSRATFSLNVIFLCALLLGVLAELLDRALQKCWRLAVTWRAS